MTETTEVTREQLLDEYVVRLAWAQFTSTVATVVHEAIVPHYAKAEDEIRVMDWIESEPEDGDKLDQLSKRLWPTDSGYEETAEWQVAVARSDALFTAMCVHMAGAPIPGRMLQAAQSRLSTANGLTFPWGSEEDA